MERQITYTEKELCDVLKCKINRVRDLRKLGVLKGTKTGKGYVYHDSEIEELFDEYRGKDLPIKKWALDSKTRLNMARYFLKISIPIITQRRLKKWKY